ncbi:alpha/beta fold hydrolase [Nocardia sp. BMG111209]|uniref:alpha/beta fold hydrolase n=1 Tax=Nocardia sp. BMG111209 TaxID=1160137 RepID=UPI000368D368|nr:alpha/beta hydrolase family protein [Nocardia sp. BMG111209]
MVVHRFTGFDGTPLAWHEIGAGRPLIFLPGFGGVGSFMVEYGPVAAIAEHGFRVLVPDSRGSGESAAPDDSTGYPADVLADDGLALVAHLGFGDGEYDLGGYSLGARIAVRMLARGARPGRAIVAGQGLAKVSGPQRGGENHRVLTALVGGVVFEPDSPDARVVRALSMAGTPPRTLLSVLDSLVPTSEADLRRIIVPALVAIGDRDDRGDADQLAALLGDARFVRVPGDHGSALAAPELAAAIVAFLTEA